MGEDVQRFKVRRFDVRTFGILTAATLLGVAWAAYNYISTGGERGEEQLRALVWTVFATPFFLFLGWLIARWSERWLAAFVCFCLYFFTFFVAARIETLVLSPEEADATGHQIYFWMVITLHGIVALGLSLWRAVSMKHHLVDSELSHQQPAESTQE